MIKYIVTIILLVMSNIAYSLDWSYQGTTALFPSAQAACDTALTNDTLTVEAVIPPLTEPCLSTNCYCQVSNGGKYYLQRYGECDGQYDEVTGECVEGCTEGQYISITGIGIPPNPYCNGSCEFELSGNTLLTTQEAAQYGDPLVYQAWYGTTGNECTEQTIIEPYTPPDPDCLIDTNIGCYDPQTDPTPQDDCYTYSGVNGDSTVCNTENPDCFTVNGEIWCQEIIPDCGQINGVSVCVDPTDEVSPGDACISDGTKTICIEEAPVTETETTTTTETLPDGTTVETTTTLNPGGSTTTTTTTTSPDGTVSTITTEEGYDEPKFTPPTKGNFPIEQAQAELEQVKTDFSNWIADKQNQVSQLIDVNIGGAPSLPIYTFTALGKTFTVDLNQASEFFTIIGTIIILISTIIALYIIMKD
jgi:hypothetical protein